MTFARAVWQDGGKFFEGVMPRNWVDEQRNIVRWPKSGRASAWKLKKKKTTED